VVIYVQEGDLLIALSQHKEHRIHKIEDLVQQICGMQHSFQLFAFMALGKAFYAVQIANALDEEIIKNLKNKGTHLLNSERL